MVYIVYFWITSKFLSLEIYIISRFDGICLSVYGMCWNFLIMNPSCLLIQDSKRASLGILCNRCTRDSCCSCLKMSLLRNIWKLTRCHSQRNVEWSKRGWQTYTLFILWKCSQVLNSVSSANNAYLKSHWFFIFKS